MQMFTTLTVTGSVYSVHNFKASDYINQKSNFQKKRIYFCILWLCDMLLLQAREFTNLQWQSAPITIAIFAEITAWFEQGIGPIGLCDHTIIQLWCGLPDRPVKTENYRTIERNLPMCNWRNPLSSAMWKVASKRQKLQPESTVAIGEHFRCHFAVTCYKQHHYIMEISYN